MYASVKGHHFTNTLSGPMLTNCWLDHSEHLQRNFNQNTTIFVQYNVSRRSSAQWRPFYFALNVLIHKLQYTRSYNYPPFRGCKATPLVSHLDLMCSVSTNLEMTASFFYICVPISPNVSLNFEIRRHFLCRKVEMTSTILLSISAKLGRTCSNHRVQFMVNMIHGTAI